MFSQRTRYILKLLFHLCMEEEDRYRTVENLSEETGIPKPYLSKIVGFLARNGLLQTQKGPTGGTKLAVDPAELPMNELLEEMGEFNWEPMNDESPTPAQKLEERFTKLCIQEFKDSILGTKTLQDVVRIVGSPDVSTLQMTTNQPSSRVE